MSTFKFGTGGIIKFKSGTRMKLPRFNFWWERFPLSAFPGTVGYGADTSHFRNAPSQRIVWVTNTSSSAAISGSFPYAVQTVQDGDCILFKTSGVCDYREVGSSLQLIANNVAVYFETAPSPGFTFIGDTLVINGNDILISHPRIRVGDHPSGSNYDTRDGMRITGSPRTKIVVRHPSITWSVDECFSVVANCISGSDSGFTLYGGLIAEALAYSFHTEQPHSMGVFLDDNNDLYTVYQNLLMHHIRRNPRADGAEIHGIFSNNIAYNATAVAAGELTGRPSPAASSSASYYSYVNCLGFKGPDTDSGSNYYVDLSVIDQSTPPGQIYTQSVQPLNSSSEDWGRFGDEYVRYNGQTETCIVFDWPYSPPLNFESTILPATQSLVDHLILIAGARPLDRDATDTRLISEAMTMTQSYASRTGSRRDVPPPDEWPGTGSLVDWPQNLAVNFQEWESHSLYPSNPFAINGVDGYSEIERFIFRVITKSVEPINYY